jgi:outer membrane protein assembly factor BamB
VRTNRAFITDFAPEGGGRLYAFNISPFDDVDNPFAPGQLVWSAVVGATSGASPSYGDGLVVVATIDGELIAFDARATSEENPPLWWASAADDGFFGGVAVAGGYCYAASYDFYGGQNNSSLVKLALTDGELIWRVACERTSAIPIVRGDGDIYLAGGVRGFGSRVKLQHFFDFGDRAELIWDTHAATDGRLDIGGWTHQPVLSGSHMLVGRAPERDFLDANRSLLLIDLDVEPGDPGFVIDELAGAGGSPAVWNGRVFSIGSAGLHAIVSGLIADMNCDARIDFDDIDAFVLALIDEAAYNVAYPDCDAEHADVNRDGRRDFDDIDAFVEELIG